jgi:hypothetical protein
VSDAKGRVCWMPDTSSKQLFFTADYAGLTTRATMAHFHGPADPGKNAAIVEEMPSIAAFEHSAAFQQDSVIEQSRPEKRARRRLSAEPFDYRHLKRVAFDPPSGPR